MVWLVLELYCSGHACCIQVNSEVACQKIKLQQCDIFMFRLMNWTRPLLTTRKARLSKFLGSSRHLSAWKICRAWLKMLGKGCPSHWHNMEHVIGNWLQIYYKITNYIVFPLSNYNYNYFKEFICNYKLKHCWSAQDVSNCSGVENSYFTESEIYWAPSSNPSELYAQLSKFKFREILRPQIRSVGSLNTYYAWFYQCLSFVHQLTDTVLWNIFVLATLGQ